MFNKFFQSVVPPPVLEATETLATRYQQQVAQQHLCYDAAQLAALSHLQDLLDHLLLVAHYDSQSYLHKLVVPTPPKAKSVYLYGDVGRGKSMLMSLFYEACPIEQKQRLHFNCFMLDVHAFIHECRQTPNTDAISALAQKIRANTLLLCLDEFHVTDIADAMILERLFGKLFDLGLYVVFTSNRHPDDLYQGGLQRE
ncbi:MAG: cell division protein ZapE, partial [Methylococcaceae bacterium]|nr:cell division protein ZapE [Methylococcaceae bacterium]